MTSNMPSPDFIPSDPLTTMQSNLAAPPQHHRSTTTSSSSMRVFVCRYDKINESKVCLLDPQRTPTIAEFQKKVAGKLQIDVSAAAGLYVVMKDGDRALVEGLEEIREGDKLALKEVTVSHHSPSSVTDGSASQTMGNPFASMEISVPHASPPVAEPQQSRNRAAPKRGKSEGARKPKAKKSSKKSASPKKKRREWDRELSDILEVWDSSFVDPIAQSKTRSSTTPRRNGAPSPSGFPAFLSPRQAKVSAQSSLNENALAKKAVAKAVEETIAMNDKKKKRGNTDIPSSDQKKPPAKKVKQEVDPEDPFPVHGKFFYKDCDFEYPVQIIAPEDSEKLKKNQRKVYWIGYSNEWNEIIDVKWLLPWTKEREETFYKVTVPFLEKKIDKSSSEEKDTMEEEEQTQTQAGPRHRLTLSSSSSSSQPTSNNTSTGQFAAAASARQDRAEGNFAPMVFEVGSKYFVKYSDDVEYPVVIVRFCTKTDTEKFFVRFLGYKKTEMAVSANDLLPVTPNRERDYQSRKAFSKYEKRVKLQKSQQRSTQQPKERKPQLKKQKKDKPKPRLKEEQQQKPLEEDPEDPEDRLWGPATDIANLPTRNDDESERPPGTFWKTDNRLVYFAHADERPKEIAQKFQLPIEKLLYDNRKIVPWGKHLKANSHLKSSTPFVLPLQWNGKEIKLHTSTGPTAKRRDENDNEGNVVGPTGDLEIEERQQSVVAGPENEVTGLIVELSSDESTVT